MPACRTISSGAVCHKNGYRKDLCDDATSPSKNVGQDLLRTKGILAYEGDDRRFAFQAVHMIADGDFIGPWKEGDPRRSKLVFIGRDLNRPLLRRGFEACQAGEDEAKINAEIARWSPPDA